MPQGIKNLGIDQMSVFNGQENQLDFPLYNSF